MLRTNVGWMLLILVVPGSLVSGQERRREPYDIVIRGGTIVDGTGNPWFEGDVAIRGDRIAAIGHLGAEVNARRVIDARGLIVAPGFIDMHSHSDRVLLTDGDANSKIRDGVTTEILGEDTSAGPVKGKLKTRGNSPPSWTTLGGYFDALESRGISVNVASYVGLGTLLGCVLGDSLRRPDASAARSDEGATGRSDARRGDRAVHHARQPARTRRDHR